MHSFDRSVRLEPSDIAAALQISNHTVESYYERIKINVSLSGMHELQGHAIGHLKKHTSESSRRRTKLAHSPSDRAARGQAGHAAAAKRQEKSASDAVADDGETGFVVIMHHTAVGTFPYIQHKASEVLCIGSPGL